MAAAVAGVTDTASSTGAVAKTKKSAVEDQQDRFLKLLVTQMRNQDPLNPLDNAQVTSQMAQLSTVTGIEKLNATLSAFTKAQAFQAAGLIGHHVLAPGEFVNLNAGSGVAGVDLASAADSVKVKIFDADGNLVRDLDLGKQEEGASLFMWDGKTNTGLDAPDGAYSFRVSAALGADAVEAKSLAVGMVNSVLMDGTGSALDVQGLGQVGFDEIRQIL